MNFFYLKILEEIIENIQPTIAPFQFSVVNISLIDGLKILLISLLAGLFVKYIFQRFSNTFSSKSSFGNTLLLVTISVSALIAVVKSSLALSLGLVGALSVIRFRTAIKEPYNLSFLLWSICLGISLGAGQFSFAFLIAIIGAFSIIIVFKGIYKQNKRKRGENGLDTLSVSFKGESTPNKLYRILDKYSISYLTKSINKSEDNIITATLGVDVENQEMLSEIMDKISNSLEESNITFYNSPTL